MRTDVAARQDASPAAREAQDWHAFSSTHLPGRRRHDLEALTAYGEYRRAHAAGEGSPAKNGAAGPTALQDWEDEGGATTA